MEESLLLKLYHMPENKKEALKQANANIEQAFNYLKMYTGDPSICFAQSPDVSLGELWAFLSKKFNYTYSERSGIIASMRNTIYKLYPKNSNLDLFMLAAEIGQELAFIKGLWSVIFRNYGQILRWKTKTLSNVIKDFYNYTDDCFEELSEYVRSIGNKKDMAVLLSHEGNYCRILAKEIKLCLPFQYGRLEKFYKYRLLEGRLRHKEELWNFFLSRYRDISRSVKVRTLSEVIYSLMGKDKGNCAIQIGNYLSDNTEINCPYVPRELYISKSFNSYDILDLLENELDSFLPGEKREREDVTRGKNKIEKWISEIKSSKELLQVAHRPHRFKNDLSSYLDVLEESLSEICTGIEERNKKYCKRHISWAKKTMYLLFVDAHGRDWFSSEGKGKLEAVKLLYKLIFITPYKFEDKIRSIGDADKSSRGINWSETYGNFDLIRIFTEACDDGKEEEQYNIVEWSIKTYMDGYKIGIDEDDLASIRMDSDEGEILNEEIKGEYRHCLNPLKAACRSGNLKLVKLLYDELYDHEIMRQKWIKKELLSGNYSPEIMGFLNI